MQKETILQEAQRIVYGDRAVEHGDFKDNFTTAASIFTSWTGVVVTAEQMVQALICLKMARQKGNPKKRDHYVDSSGYWEILSRLEGV